MNNWTIEIFILSIGSNPNNFERWTKLTFYVLDAEIIAKTCAKSILYCQPSNFELSTVKIQTDS